MNTAEITHISQARNRTAARDTHGTIRRGVITAELREGIFMIDASLEAAQAFSCIVRPQKGDVAAYVETPVKSYVLAILEREGNHADIQVNGADELHIKAGKLSLAASEEVKLDALKSVHLTAYLGTLSLTGTNVVATAKESIIQSAKTQIGNMINYTLKARQLLRFHGKHQILTADEEIRMDGERINMG